MASRWRLEDLPELAGRWMAGADYYLLGFGWMFGLMFFTFGAAPILEGEGADPVLLALGIALLALARAAAVGIYARRHRCRCGEAETGKPPGGDAA